MADQPAKKPKRVSPSAQVTAMKPDDLPSPAPATPRPANLLKLGSMLGKYRLKAVLGSGGMGTVYAAEDSIIKRTVAIKVLPPELARDKSLINRLLAEAQSAGKLNHANVVTLYDVGETAGSYYIVMELVPGGSVQDYLARKGSPGWRAATRLIGEAAKALAAAHEVGLIHRDIKPSNLMLTNDGHVKVVDFGLAKAEAAGDTMHTQPGAILGTPAFMSPEQCRGDKLDARTDIYSLGCTYYAMLTGKPPFEAATSMQVMFAHCSAPIPDPRELNADTPQACVEILTKAVEKNVEDRYASARDMVNDLRAALSGASTVMDASPITALTELANAPAAVMDYRSPTKQSNRKILVYALAGGIAAIVLLGVLAMFFSFHATATVSSPVAVVASPGPPMPTPMIRPVAQKTEVSSAIEPATTQSAESTLEFQPVATPSTTAPSAIVLPQNAVAMASSNPHVAPPTATPPPTTVPAAAPKPFEALITNSINEKLVLIKPGVFTMGDGHMTDAPLREVKLTHTIYMDAYEVTQGEYDKVMGKNDGLESQHTELPAAMVSWELAVDFCRRLSEVPAEKAAGRTYRLPTEAEWEYACRAGAKTKYAFGDTLTTDQANFGKKTELAMQHRNDQPPMDGGGAGNAGGPGNEGPADRPGQGERPNGPLRRRQAAMNNGNNNGPGSGNGQDRPQPPNDNGQHPLEPGGRFSPNAWGLYDMHGNVWEWCSDWYAADTYKQGNDTDPTGPATGTIHVARGGAWNSPAALCASAYRNGKPDFSPRMPFFGFRIVCDVQP